MLPETLGLGSAWRGALAERFADASIERSGGCVPRYGMVVSIAALELSRRL